MLLFPKKLLIGKNTDNNNADAIIFKNSAILSALLLIAPGNNSDIITQI